MNSDLFIILNNDTSVKILLATNPPSVDSSGSEDYGVLRVFPYGKAPEDVELPYSVYSVITALPENYLDINPDIDSMRIQMGIYSENEENLQECFEAVRNAVEPYAHMVNFSTPDVDADTQLYSCRMEFDFWNVR